jgi:hypothetical protein
LTLINCTEQRDDEKAIFNAKAQKCKDAGENQQIFAPLHLCTSAPLHLCVENSTLIEAGVGKVDGSEATSRK